MTKKIGNKTSELPLPSTSVLKKDNKKIFVYPNLDLRNYKRLHLD